MSDVVVAGAGPNGLMTACELALAGVHAVVLDPLPGADPQPRANGLVGQVVRMLDRRGLHERLAATTDPPRPLPHYLFAGFPLPLDGLADNPVYAIGAAQGEVVRMLAARAVELGVEIRWGHSLAGIAPTGDGVTVRVEGPDGPYELATAYLVGADGGHSPTRKLAGIAFPGVSTDDSVNRTANAVPPADWVDPESLVLDVPGHGRVPPFLHHRTERGVFVWAPFPGRPLVSTTEFAPPMEEGPLRLAELSVSAGRVLGAELPLREPDEPGPRLLRRVVGGNSRLAQRYRAGRVLLVGDAAHVHSAIGGAGLNLGLQDAVNLGWKLAAVVGGRVEEELLDTYEAERRPVSERVLMQTRAQTLLVGPGPEVTALRALFGELLAEPRTVAHIADLLAGADVRYACPDGAHPAVGRWAPDLVVETADGVRRLAELTRDGRPVLFDFDGRYGDWPHQIHVVRGRAVGPAPTALLVRPDGYVAWAADLDRPDPDGLRTAARHWFGVERRPVGDEAPPFGCLITGSRGSGIRPSG